MIAGYGETDAGLKPALVEISTLPTLKSRLVAQVHLQVPHQLLLQVTILSAMLAVVNGQMSATALATADGAGPLTILLSGIHRMQNADASEIFIL
jgi:hypothetical protein